MRHGAVRSGAIVQLRKCGMFGLTVNRRHANAKYLHFDHRTSLVDLAQRGMIFCFFHRMMIIGVL